jgi:hypothetical protein
LQVVNDDAIAKTRISSGSWWTAFKNMLREVFISDEATTTSATATKHEVKVVVSQLDNDQKTDTDIDSDSESEEQAAVTDDDAAAIVIEQTQQLNPGIHTYNYPS